MARSKKSEKSEQTKFKNAKVNEAKLLRHIGRLNLRTKEAYKDWCLQHGFNTSFAKTDVLRQRELKKHGQILSQQRLRQHSSESKLHLQIEKIASGKVRSIDLRCPILVEVSDSFRKCKKPDLLLESLLYLERRSKLLSEPLYIRGIAALVDHRDDWQRELNQWRPQKHSASRQFAALTRYLLANYHVPAFMDNVWLYGNKKQQDWFIHIGSGNNIRTAKSLPVSLTKKMAHQFLQAPDKYSVLEAFRWAQIQSLGGDKNLCDSFVETRLGRRFKDDEFWLSVIRFFIGNPMMDRIHIHPIVDYIWNEKYAEQYEYDADGRVRNIGPAQPNFSMRGRTGDSLLEQVENWHRRLGRSSQANTASRWHRWIIKDYKFVEGNSSADSRREWSIRELLSSGELLAEGRKQKHCVASYASPCVNGESSIYTMDIRDRIGERKLLTIEVSRKYRKVYQVRGKRNRLPTNAETQIVQRWSQANNLIWEGG